jgi:hypothetical protein
MTKDWIHLTLAIFAPACVNQELDRPAPASMWIAGAYTTVAASLVSAVGYFTMAEQRVGQGLVDVLNWPLIGGVFGGLLLAGLALAIVSSRRQHLRYEASIARADAAGPCEKR